MEASDRVGGFDATTHRGRVSLCASAANQTRQDKMGQGGWGVEEGGTCFGERARVDGEEGWSEAS